MTRVQQYTKTAAHLDQLGEQARKLRQEMADATDAVAETREELKGYNERRREQTAKLKEILTPVIEHLLAGGIANGVKGLHAWAAWYNPTAKDGKNAARQIMRIVKSAEKGKGDMKSPSKSKLDLTPTFFGMDVGKLGGHVVVEIEKVTHVRYKTDDGERREGGDWSDPEAFAAGEWIHTVREVHGKLSFDVYLPGATPKEILKVLIAKTKEGLRALRLPTDAVLKGIKEDRKDLAQHEKAMEKKRKDEKNGTALKKLRQRHISHEIGRKSLCGTALNKTNKANKRYPATCEKCIQLAAQLPPPAPKIKKIKAADTTTAIEKFLRPLICMTADQFMAVGCDITVPGNAQRWVSNRFEEEIVAHPEWNTGRVVRARRELAKHHARLEEQEQQAEKINVRLTEAQMREVTLMGVPDLKMDRKVC